jgi:hypothetical protein
LPVGDLFGVAELGFFDCLRLLGITASLSELTQYPRATEDDPQSRATRVLSGAIAIQKLARRGNNPC